MQPITVAGGTRVTMAGHELVFGQTIFPPCEANPILDDAAALRARIEVDGYLLIRDFYDRDAVMAARREILEHLSTRGFLDPDAPMDDSVIGPDNSGPVLRNEVVVNLHAYLRVVNSDRYRHSTDNRYQLAAESVDERHMGLHPDQIPKAHNRKTMAEMREKWGI